MAGTKVRMADGTDSTVELLKEGDKLLAADGGEEVVLAVRKSFRKTVRILTTGGDVLQCSNDQALVRDIVGYVLAHESQDEIIRAEKKLTTVTRVEAVNGALVFGPELSRSHTFLANGLWLEGW